jgi:hypothetical protein
MLVELGSGTLEIDALTGQCEFQGKLVVQLPIAKELVGWLQQDLAKHRIPTAGLVRAHLSAKLSFSQIPWNTKTKENFYSNGKAVRSKDMHKCIFECDSEVTTGKTVYRSKQTEIQEWPVGWPTA